MSWDLLQRTRKSQVVDNIEVLVLVDPLLNLEVSYSPNCQTHVANFMRSNSERKVVHASVTAISWVLLQGQA